VTRRISEGPTVNQLLTQLIEIEQNQLAAVRRLGAIFERVQKTITTLDFHLSHDQRLEELQTERPKQVEKFLLSAKFEPSIMPGAPGLFVFEESAYDRFQAWVYSYDIRLVENLVSHLNRFTKRSLPREPTSYVCSTDTCLSLAFQASQALVDVMEDRKEGQR